jgi:hypothetical protein
MVHASGESISTRRQRSAWLRSRSVWIAVVLVVVVLAIRVAIDPLATRFTQRGLDAMQGYEGTFEDVSFSLIKLDYRIHGLVIRMSDEPDPADPLVVADEVHARVLWRNLVRGTVLGTARIEGARVFVPFDRAAEAQPPGTTPNPRRIDDAIQSLIPIRLERVELRDCAIAIGKRRSAPETRLRFDQIEAAIENFTTRRALDEGRPMTVALRCTLQDSGRLSAFVSIEPLAVRPTFAGEARVDSLELDDLHGFLVAVLEQDVVPSGTFEMFASFQCADGHVTGGVKPLLRHPGTEAVSDDWNARFVEVFTDAGLALFSDRVPQREATAAIIPLEGDLEDVGVGVWPSIVSVLRNAFVVGLSASFRGLPPDEPANEQGDGG